MIKITDKNRDSILEEYVTRTIHDMDAKTLAQFAYDIMIESKGLMENHALEMEILDYCSDLLEGSEV